MKVLCASLALCTVLTLTRASPVNSTMPKMMGGMCMKMKIQCMKDKKPYPKCDDHGNFLPRQSGPDGTCFCVNTMTGKMIPGSSTAPGEKPVNCDDYSNYADYGDYGDYGDYSDYGEMDLLYYYYYYYYYFCPYGWSGYGDRCFIFIDQPKKWAEAESYCLFDGGNLASIHNYEEQHFVQSLTRGDSHNFPQSWIGGFDAIYMDFWMWSDGSKFYYKNWHDDDYNDQAKCCLKMNYEYDWKWAPAFCNDTLPFVCSKRICSDKHVLGPLIDDKKKH